MPNWSQGGQGAVGGALGGAGIGSMFGPVGMGVGAGVGGLLGGLGGLLGGGESDNDAKHRQMLEEYYKNVLGRQPPQAGPAAQGGYSGFRSNQSDLIARLEALSKGQGPSLAAQQFQQATDRNVSSQQALAAGGRGGPLASFNAANNIGMLGANAAQGSAQARIQEQQMALGMLGQNINAGRGSDESMNQFNAGQQNNTSLANLQARLQSMGMNDQAITQILGQLGGQNAAQNAQPGLGSQLLAGGAGMFAFGAGQRAQQNAANANKPAPGPASSMPGGGGLGSLSAVGGATGAVNSWNPNGW